MKSRTLWFSLIAAILSLTLGYSVFLLSTATWREFWMPGSLGPDLAYFSQGFYNAVDGDLLFRQTVYRYVPSALSLRTICP